jgi:hypothetical protein
MYCQRVEWADKWVGWQINELVLPILKIIISFETPAYTGDALPSEPPYVSEPHLCPRSGSSRSGTELRACFLPSTVSQYCTHWHVICWENSPPNAIMDSPTNSVTWLSEGPLPSQRRHCWVRLQNKFLVEVRPTYGASSGGGWMLREKTVW